MGRILAIDYGEKRIGLAISDELLLFSIPLDVIKNNHTTIQKIKSIVEKNNVTEILVGYPQWDRCSHIHKLIKNFTEELKKEIDINIKYTNEFYSTKHAVEKLQEIGKKYKKAKIKIDSYSACIILQEYLEKIKNANF